MEPDHERITETLEALAVDVHPRGMAKDENEPLWGVELEDGSGFTLQLIPGQRKLVISTSLAHETANNDASYDLHEVLLSDVQNGADRGGVNCGLDDEGLVFHYDLAMSMLSLDTLGKAFLALLHAKQRWMESAANATSDTPANRPPEPPSDVLRV